MNYELSKLRSLPIEAVAERLGISVARHKAICPFHADTHPSLSFSTQRNTYRCFVCGAAGNPIDLVMKYTGKSFADACRWLEGGKPPCPPVGGGATKDASSDTPHRGEGGANLSRYARFFDRPQLSLAAQQFLYTERRIDPRVVRWCRIASWQDRNGANWLQTPYYDATGHRLIGVQFRNLDHKPADNTPRFRFPRGSRCQLYNLPVTAMLRHGEPLYITEGCSDCWAMLSAGRKAIAIPSATLLKPADTAMLASLSQRLGTTFHMYPDNDTPGELLYMQLSRSLPGLVRHQLPPDCKDFADMYANGKFEL